MHIQSFYNPYNPTRPVWTTLKSVRAMETDLRAVATIRTRLKSVLTFRGREGGRRVHIRT